MQWYVSQNGKTTGPFDEERLAMLVHWGKITRDAFICDKQCSAWIALRCSAFAQLLPHPTSERRRFGGLVSAVADGPSSDPEAPATRSVERETKQALGLVALSLILAGFLMAAM
jgi:hypothetical protein